MKGVLGLCFSLSGAAALALEVLWMRSARLVLGASYSVAVGASILSCAAPPGPPPLPATARTIAVLPPNNRTGDPLLIESASFLHPDADRPGRVTVSDALATEARAQLARRGVKVIAPEAVTAAIGNQTPRSPEEAADLATRGKLEGSALYIEIRRWEADMSPLHPRRIIVALEARLLDAATGQTVWTAQWPLHPVPTPGAVVRWMAYTIAARKVAEELFASTTMEEHTMQGRTPTSRRAEVPSTGARPPGDMQDNPVARQLLQEAHARMYKWPATFAGYRAMLTVQEEERLWHGEATVRPRQAVEVQLMVITVYGPGCRRASRPRPCTSPTSRLSRGMGGMS
jgi:hypothetical protein